MTGEAVKPDHGRGNASVKSAALWAASSQYLLFGLQFVTSVIISRFFLKPEEVGLFSVALASAMLLSIIQDFGLTRYIGRHPTADEETVQRCTLIAIVFALLLSLLILGIAWPVAAFYGEPRLAHILALIAASYLFVPLSTVPMALLFRRLDFRKAFTVNISGALANSSVALTLAALGFSAESLAWGMIAQSAVRAVAAQIARPTPIRFHSGLRGFRDILSFGSESVLLYLSTGIGMRTPDMIVGRILGMTAAGLFSRGSALAVELHALVTGAVSAVYYPTFARLKDDGEDLGPYYARLVAAHGAIVWPAMILLAVLAEPVILLLYGKTWAGAAPLLAWLAIAECLFTAVPMHLDMPILLGKVRRLLFVNLADSTIAVATLIVGATIGLQEAAAARIAYGIGWFCLYAFWMQRLVGFDWKVVTRIYLVSALVAAATATPAIWAVYIWKTPDTLGLFGLVVAGLGAGSTWLVSIIALRHPAREDLIGMAKHAAGPVLSRLKLRPA